ncbi:polysaccharide deacetylase family protein [Pseudomonas eucalypticola]|uniref:Polysaccharide deacetylase family protein n=1 Tax=Pseudomonas eucalypticola TaxID=2599595 RepID=A0A7D5DB79_9PSED|nr:polysaccharide deacetylase family protein [Pseudomonas eucalypticola]QKZ07600.1 polysaccharide deacetylase family protein [Pseudomonas eucalypticola]
MERSPLRIASLFFAALASFQAQAAVPPAVATIDRSTWPETLSSPALFDVASRAEILMFAHTLLQSEALDDAALADRLDLRTVNMPAIKDLRQQLWQRLWQNYNQAQQSCGQDASFCFAVDSLDDLRTQANNFAVAPDSFYANWGAPARVFDLIYLDELLRKAALSPQISSEVLKVSADEINGSDFNDRVFLLTFDSGPSIAVGSTEWVADFLRTQSINATFFVLGQNFAGRREQGEPGSLEALYKGQCVGIQGWQYRSHADWNDWEGSITRTTTVVENELPDNYVPLFRPPYGTRRADAGVFLGTQQMKVALWDIDSQDSNSQLTAEQSAQRVLTLMLLWRHGVIAFHDTQAKVQTALPWLLTQTAQAGIGWQECRQFQ